MAARPWLTPQELKAYTEMEKVKARSDVKVQADITRAENYIIHRTNNDFSDNAKYPTIPDDVKLAAMLVAEHYSAVASSEPQTEYQSETFKDYSYTKKTSIDKSVDDVDIDALISRYVQSASVGTLALKLRKL